MTLLEALRDARTRGSEIAARQEDTGLAHLDVALLRIEKEWDSEVVIAEAGFVVEWYEHTDLKGQVRRGYALAPDTKAMAYGRLCAVLEMVDALREAGFSADTLHRSHN
jgi:hypothetical protein